MTALRTNTAALVTMPPTDSASGPAPLLWMMLPTDRVSGHDTPALDDVADLTA